MRKQPEADRVRRAEPSRHQRLLPGRLVFGPRQPQQPAVLVHLSRGFLLLRADDVVDGAVGDVQRHELGPRVGGRGQPDDARRADRLARLSERLAERDHPTACHAGLLGRHPRVELQRRRYAHPRCRRNVEGERTARRSLSPEQRRRRRPMAGTADSLSRHDCFDHHPARISRPVRAGVPSFGRWGKRYGSFRPQTSFSGLHDHKKPDLRSFLRNFTRRIHACVYTAPQLLRPRSEVSSRLTLGALIVVLYRSC